MTDETTPQAETPAQGALPLPETAPTETVETPTTEVEATDTPAADSSKPEPKGIGRRIDELTRLRRDAERERDHWREMAMRQQHQPDPPKAPEPPATLPTLESVGYDESKYQAALLKYAESAATKAAEAVLQRREQERVEKERTDTWQKRQAKFAEKTHDYTDKVTDPSLPISQAMTEVIMESEVGPELAYYLANNREIAASIAQLPERAAARELGRLEATLSQQKAAATRPAATPKPIVSQAPPPPATLETSDAATPSVKPTDPESDKAYSDKDWFKARERQLARKRK
jgi:hypothetical protein